MESCLNEEEKRPATINWREKGVILLFQGLANVRVSAYENLNKVSSKERGVLYVLEEKLAILQWNVNATHSFHNKVQKGLDTPPCIPLPSANLEINNEPTCLWIENYPFYGLNFKLLWVGQIVSCKHVYHG
jgi:hypothetical protein